MPVQNNCTPQSIYGGYTQTLFLGLSVLDFSATAGWNEQASTLTVKLVKDECGGTRDYFDDNFNWQTSVNFPNGDPGFNNAPIGSAAFFKVENFEFAGLIQSYNITEDPGGMPILIVNLISPNILLDGAQVITDEYQGSVLSMPNVFNVYGWLESRNQNCPAIGGFGAPAGGFGNARRNDRGIPWYFAKGALQVLLGGALTSNYSWHGGITYKQGLAANRYGNIRSEGYVVDITDMPTTTDIYYRLTNGNYTLSELISEVCKDGGYEYYIDLVPCRGGPTAPITNVIKVRTVSRRAQPALGEIVDFINAQNATSAGKIITQDSVGEELRNDSPNSAFIVGAKKQQIYQQTSSSFISPFFGFNDEGGFNTFVNSGGQWIVDLDVRSLNLSLSTTIPANTITVTESTICAAMGLSQDAFLSWLQTNLPSSDLATYFFTTLSLNAPANIGLGAALGKPATDASRPAGHGSRDPQTSQAKDASTVFGWLKSYANETYGKKWLIAVPWVCWTYDPETAQLLLSDEVSTDGGWPGSSSVLGMTFGSSYTDFFADEQGKLSTMMKFAGAIDTSLLSDEDYVTDGTSVWVKGDVEDKWAITPATVFGAQYAAALVTIPNRVTVQSTLGLSQTMYGGVNFRSPSPGGDFDPTVNPAAFAGPAALPFFAPVSAAIPVKSNTTTYGPWLATASDLIVNGHPFGGKIFYEKDDGLSPWEYGGTTYMNLGALAKINNSITNETVSERGAVTIAGYPEKTLGLAITDSPSLIQSRVLQSSSYDGDDYHFVNTGGVSTKAAQITNINVTVNGSAITTEYQISSFTPVFGRFSKDNAERIKQIGQTRLKFGRQLRAAAARRARLAGSSRRAAVQFQQFMNMLNQSDADTGASVFLTGKKFGNRAYVVNNTMGGSANFDDWANSALMSLDGFQKPVQKRSASSDLPKEVADPNNPTTSSQAGYSESAPPPLNEYQPLRVSTDYLDFLAIPNSNLAGRSAAPDSGHNIDTVARGTKANFDTYTGLASIPAIEEQGGDGYAQSDYRYLAHRGPLVVNGWGYDLAGKPVPNSGGADVEGSWQDNYDGLADTFKEGWLQNDKLWPTAPVDLRYDRRRGVWTTPPSFRMYKVTGNPISAGGSGPVVVLNADDVYDSAGNLITTKTLNITNITDSTTPSGQDYIAYYDNVNNQYWPIFPGSGGGGLSGICIEFDAQYECGNVSSISDAAQFKIGNGLQAEGYESAACNGTNQSGVKLSTVHKLSALNLCLPSDESSAGALPIDKKTFGNLELGNGFVVFEFNGEEEGSPSAPEGAGAGGDLCTYRVEAPLLVSGRKGQAGSQQTEFGRSCIPVEAQGGSESVTKAKTFHVEFAGAIALYKKPLGTADNSGPNLDLCETYVAKVCTPTMLYKTCDPAYGNALNFSSYTSGLALHKYDSIYIEGLSTQRLNVGPTELGLLIQHTHYIKGGCDQHPDGLILDPGAAQTNGKRFQDIQLSDAFFIKDTTGSAGQPSSPGVFGSCLLDLHVCGQTTNFPIVCDVYCQGNILAVKKRTLDFFEGVLKDDGDCDTTSTGQTAIRHSATTSNNTVVSSDYTVPDSMSSRVFVNTALGNRNITLPDASTMGPYQVVAIKTTSDVNTVVVQTPGAETINGQSTYTMTNQYESATFVTEGNDWYIV